MFMLLLVLVVMLLECPKVIVAEGRGSGVRRTRLGAENIDGLSNDAVRALLKRSISMLTTTPPSATKRTRGLSVNLFGDGTPTDTPSTTTSGTPRTDGVFASASKSLSTTFTGEIDFLEDGNQHVFASLFGAQPLPLTLALAKKSLAVEDLVTVQDKVSAFVSLSHLLIFCRIVHRRYVGSSDFDESEIIADVETELSSLKLETRVRGQTHCISPDELYWRYQDFIPLLPDDAHDWSFHLVVLFLNALPVTLKELIIVQGYKPPRFRELTTAVLQQRSLDILREKVVKAKYTFDQEKYRIKTMVNYFTNPPPRNSPRQTINYYPPPCRYICVTLRSRLDDRTDDC